MKPLRRCLRQADVTHNTNKCAAPRGNFRAGQREATRQGGLAENVAAVDSAAQ